MPRALIVDDDQLIRQLLVAALQHGGFDVVSATDGADAIAKISEDSSYDVVITDYSMPLATGIDVIEHVGRVDPTLPCVILTAFREIELAMRGMRAGAVGFIPKPFKIEHLFTVVNQALERRRLTREVARLEAVAPMLERFTMTLANTLEFKDCDTRHHSERLVSGADAIAAVMGRSEEERFTIRLGACLHDIGKVGVPESILRKNGPLTPEEMAAVRLHPDIGAAILEDAETWQDVRRIVRHHHEHFNGDGYPLGLVGSEIPIGSRIVSVVDAYDVMCAGRVYAAPRSPEEAWAELKKCSGRQFDPDVVEAFGTTLARTAPYHGRMNTVPELTLLARGHLARTAVVEQQTA